MLQVPAALLLVSAVVFVMVRLTGDPAALYLGDEATEQQRLALRKQLGLDRPILVQYLSYLGQATRGDLGYSLRYRKPAIDVVLARLPQTLLLSSTGLLLATALGILLGMMSARYQGKSWDSLLVGLSVAGQSVPGFWLGILLILVFAERLHWLPTSGVGDWRHLVLPSLTLASFILPHIALLTRTALVEILREQFIVVARGKGLSERRVIYVHALRNALNPIITIFGLQFGQLMGGSVITESIFAWPGIGQMTIQSIFNRDAPVVVTAVLIISLMIILGNLAADIAVALTDPRIRLT